MKRFYTAESVTEGHPDKLCDLIADSILDACLKEDENSRVACEVLATKRNIIVAGEITSRFEPQVFEIIKKVLESAIANAEHNDGADIDELKVKTIYVEKGMVLKRFTARAKGRGNRIVKPTCHIFLTVGN